MKKVIAILFLGLSSLTYAQSVTITPGATYGNNVTPPSGQNPANSGLFFNTTETTYRGVTELLNKNPGKKFFWIPSTASFMGGMYPGDLIPSGYTFAPASFSFGEDSYALATASSAFGAGVKSLAMNCFSVGRLNYAVGNPNSTSMHDQLFVVGNGSDISHRSNALTLLFNGTLGINMNTPNPYGPKLQVNGDIEGYDILASDVYGNNATFNDYWIYSSSPLFKKIISAYPDLQKEGDGKGREKINLLDILILQGQEIQHLKNKK